MLYAVLMLVAQLDSLPDSLPDSVPAEATIRIPRIVEIPAEVQVVDHNSASVIDNAGSASSVRDKPRIVRWERQCVNGVCRDVPVYEEAAEEIVAEAASKLRGWRGLPADEVKRLSEVVDAPARAKARAGHWDSGSCAMLCTIPSHGTHWTWDDPQDDGTPEPAWGSWEQTSFGSGNGRQRRQVEYPIRRWKN